MDALVQDVRYSIRSLARNPAVAALTILCLSVGMGLNSTMYSVVDVVSIRPLPFRDAEELVALFSSNQALGLDRDAVAFADLQDWKAAVRAFDDLAGQANQSMTITSDGGEAERFAGGLVSWNLFPMLGVSPVLGRPFHADDDRPGAEPVVMLGHGVWQRRYAGDPHIVGRVLTVDGRSHTVIGIMPPGFAFPAVTQLWVPLAPQRHDQPRGQRSLNVYARMKDGVTIDQARADIAAAAATLTTYRENDGWSATAMGLREAWIPADINLMTATMLGAVTLVLLIACANVANLLLARATVRQREIAVRAALGAGRARIVRQMLTESIVTALISAPIGVAIAYFGLEWLTASVPPDEVPYYLDWRLNGRVVLYTGVISIATGVLFGLVPAMTATDANLFGSLKDGGRGSSGSIGRNRLRSTLVVAEIALALVLLVGASLFVRSFLNLQASGTGFETGDLLTLRVFMSGEAYAGADDRIRKMEDIVQRVEALPGVTSAFASNLVPLSGGGGGGRATSDGATFERGKEPYISYFAVTPHAMRTLGVPLIAGRDFADLEGASRSAVALINGEFARRLWPGAADVLGRRFRLMAGDIDAWIAVIGVTADFQPFDVRDEEAFPFAFVSFHYMPSPNTGLTIKVAGMPPASIAGAVREAVRRSDPLLPLFDVRTAEENRQLTFWAERLFGWMFSIFGAAALLLASIGIYGVLSYSVAQRTQEIGIRMALGAGRRDVLALMLGYGARLAACGVALGIAGAVVVTRIIEAFLYNISATDPLSFAGMALFLGMIAVLAGYVPARRATSVDPIIALRAE